MLLLLVVAVLLVLSRVSAVLEAAVDDEQYLREDCEADLDVLLKERVRTVGMWDQLQDEVKERKFPVGVIAMIDKIIADSLEAEYAGQTCFTPYGQDNWVALV